MPFTLKRYNNAQLDGKAMKIEIIGGNVDVPVTTRVNVVGGTNGRNRTVAMGLRGGHGNSSIRGRGGCGVGRGRGGRGHGGVGDVWKKKTEKSAEELDKELETYHADAMEALVGLTTNSLLCQGGVFYGLWDCSCAKSVVHIKRVVGWYCFVRTMDGTVLLGRWRK